MGAAASEEDMETECQTSKGGSAVRHVVHDRAVALGGLCPRTQVLAAFQIIPSSIFGQSQKLRKILTSV
jgi:hypothetical protein